MQSLFWNAITITTVSFLIYPLFISLSGANSSSQRPQNENRHSRVNQQSNIECTTAEQPHLYQEQSPTSDVRIEIWHGSNNDDHASSVLFVIQSWIAAFEYQKETHVI
jgi:hypothetical protein